MTAAAATPAMLRSPPAVAVATAMMTPSLRKTLQRRTTRPPTRTPSKKMVVLVAVAVLVAVLVVLAVLRVSAMLALLAATEPPLASARKRYAQLRVLVRPAVEHAIRLLFPLRIRSTTAR